MGDFFWADAPKQTAFPVAAPGYSFIFAAAFSTLIFALIGNEWLACIGMLATFFICYFFRDPDRVTPSAIAAIVSPADGRVVQASIVRENPFIPGECYKIGIFMSVFNVHVNRIPFSGTIKNITYQPGRFHPADKDVASMQNEFNAVVLETEHNQRICFVQIAGLIARRIICGIREGDTVIRGQRFGMICFGSRVDVYLPAKTRINIAIGDKVTAGSSILGVLE
ncbi:MAG: phosphatidylserine decarboxylase family protein [Desulfobacterales bacterium]|jgi:phosphatidylserine decarboxylase|nr:phosphatidylserine decarboxylase family protein [Desulfobacterales bacterium]